VYLLDEVHMLSAAASNALLKTLEEPPSHVVFILATTDPNKVLPTIRSRTQQYELSLVGADEMAPHVRAIAEAAGAPVDDAVVDYVTERGAGSVRDALSALDTVLAAGGIPDDRADVNALVQALARADLASTLIAVAEATAAGVDARDLAERTARRLRDMFLVGAGVEPAELPQADIVSARELSDVMGRRKNVRALEAFGSALAQMPQSADRRLTLETALVGLLADEALGAGAPEAGPPASAPARGGAGAPAPPTAGPAAARAAMAATTAPPSLDAPPAAAPVPPEPHPDTSVEAAVAPAPPVAPPDAASLPPRTAEPAPSAGSAMSAAELQRMWEPLVVGKLRPVAAGLFRDATVLAHERNVVTVRLTEGVPLAQARRRSNEVEPILSELLDQTVRLEVSDAGGVPVPASAEPPQSAASTSTEDASSSAAQQTASGGPTASTASQEDKVQRIVDRFPGSVVVRDDESAD